MARRRSPDARRPAADHAPVTERVADGLPVTAPERLLALQRSAGNAAVARALLQRNGPTSAPPSATPASERQAYDQSVLDKALFCLGAHAKANHRPSTGRGNFDVSYLPRSGELQITVKCHFNFIPGNAADWPDADADELVWENDKAAKWKADFMKVVTEKWSGKHTFYCTKKWWENLVAKVKIVFVENDDKPHYDLNVMKIPKGEQRGSSVTAPSKAGGKGKTKFDSEDLRKHKKKAGQQTPALHEAGHMLGLGDEYPDKRDASKSAAHEKLVKAEFGHGVPRKRDGRIMSNGEDIQPEHGVTFLEALRDATAMKEWSFDKKPPAPKPMPEYIDGPLPRPPDGTLDPSAPPAPPEVRFA
jgi:hypothetical protein